MTQVGRVSGKGKSRQEGAVGVGQGAEARGQILVAWREPGRWPRSLRHGGTCGRGGRRRQNLRLLEFLAVLKAAAGVGAAWGRVRACVW